MSIHIQQEGEVVGDMEVEPNNEEVVAARAHAVDCVRAGAEGAVFLPGEVRHGGGQLL